MKTSSMPQSTMQIEGKQLFDNGYGISVIPERLNGKELYEVAVLTHNRGKHAHLTYDTDITNDVVRFCTVNAVGALIERISSLPKAE